MWTRKASKGLWRKLDIGKKRREWPISGFSGIENISNFARRFGTGQKPVFQRRRGSGTRFLHTTETEEEWRKAETPINV